MPRDSEVNRREFLKTGAGFAALSNLGFIPSSKGEASPEAPQASLHTAQGPRGWWPQPYSVHRDESTGRLTLQTRYYTIEHDLKKGGAIARISYTHGKAANLLLQPLGAWVRLKKEAAAPPPRGRRRQRHIFSDLNDPSPAVSSSKSGKAEVVTVEASLLDDEGQKSGVKTKTTYSYRWGYVKIHKEFAFPEAPLKLRAMSILSGQLDPSLTHYSYKPNISEDFSPVIHTWEVNGWGKVRAGSHFDAPYQTRYVPRYLALVNPGVEGIEWFASDALEQWDYQMTGQPGTGNTEVGSRTKPLAVTVSISPLDLAPAYDLPRGGFISASGSYSFDYYIGMPILEGHGQKPWFERSYTPNRGKWVSEDEIRQNAALGVETMTLHNDGDQYGDGLYWRDGSWPPYPPDQMKKMAGVIENCHKYGIKTVPYFSCHELSQSTPEFKQHGEEWGRKPDDQGNLRPNHYYGALMCLKSGWLDYLKHCVDRVLKHYPFDGVYYDWNLALYCDNAGHVGKSSNGVSGTKGLGTYALSPTGHWDVDELLEFVEWSRERVGQDGLVLIHNTMAPMFATDNFANAVCCMEFGYGQLSTSMPKPSELPLEWNFGGARSRAVIEYGTIARTAPKSLHQLFYLTALVTGVATWPASDGVLKLFRALKPLGDLEQYQFEDWRNRVVSLDHEDCFSAVYSRPGEAYAVLVNLDSEARHVRCTVNPQALASPIAALSFATLRSSQPTTISAESLMRGGQKILLPAQDAVLLHMK
ncbi:MAG TPA: DUF6259 domain-containing protein [Terriglobia bacterium]|nr:DUF6259 domain-containing protein [Terriglobia bacterium]